ncbi:kinase-like domain-containing protein [Dunaliella salina]|uniref:Kinase-like domain-containing protein n=1 Tax=Dunaliella salina TaxID=3046 RepID=A0ABQ7G8R7_DUNSA|nr:kinase-like domain-containing protein [Dunaliella salina]|eukprot:KAF5830992.1 kinase-like domain-containing protein [Dunaliella salina]
MVSLKAPVVNCGAVTCKGVSSVPRTHRRAERSPQRLSPVPQWGLAVGPQGMGPQLHVPRLQAMSDTRVEQVPMLADALPEGEDLGWRDDFHLHYIQGRHVGSGSFGEVFVGIDLKTGREVAIKSLPKVRGKLSMEKTLEKLAREVDILDSLQGDPGIIQLVDCFEDSSSVKIVTELCTGGDLQHFIEQDGYVFNEASLAMVAQEVIKVIHYCHSKGMLHGDVKPANFCIKDKANNPLLHSAQEAAIVPQPRSWLKAIDFGCSQQLPGLRSLTKRTGTPVYMAPEIFGRRYHAEADMWSLGVMLYQLFAHRFPFWSTMEQCKASKLDEVAIAVTEATIPYDYGPWLQMSQEGLEFIQGCLTRDPHCRMTIEEALVHPWLHHQAVSTHPPTPQKGQWQQNASALPSNNIVSKGAKSAVSVAA